MYVKHAARAAAIAASVSLTGMVAGAGLADAGPVPLAPPCSDNQATCQPGPGPGSGSGSGSGGQQSTAPQSPRDNGGSGQQGGNAPQSPSSASSAPTTQGGSTPQTSEGNAPQSPQGGSTPQSPQGGNAPQTTESNAPSYPDHRNSEEPNPSQTPGSGTSSASPQTSASQRPEDVPHPPPFTPTGTFMRGNDQVGGPRDAPRGFSAPDHGAPPPPPERHFGWNDGPPPGGPPRDWDGPPPPGGWDGPPPPGGWNRRWDGPPRDVDYGRRDFGRFDYDDYYAIPVFNPMFGGFGFWFFGLWIPLF